MKTICGRCAIVFLLLGIVSSSVDAEDLNSSSQFYKGRQITLVEGLNPGGGFDAYARLVTQHMGKYIPGEPSFVIKYMPGAGSLIAANYLYVRAPQNGTEIGLISGDISIAPLIGNAAAKFDSRNFNWLGSADSDSIYCVAWRTAPFYSFTDVLSREMVVGAAGTQMVNTGNVFNQVVRSKFRIVKGYDGTNGLRLAMERGEIQGWCGIGLLPIKTTNPEWLSNGTVRIIGQIGYDSSSEARGVQNIADYAANDDDRALLKVIFSYLYMSRPFVAPPKLPSERVTVLRSAFSRALKDPELLKQAEKINVRIQPVEGSAIDQFIRTIYQTPPAVLERASRMMMQEEK